MSRLMRRELDSQNRGGPVRQFLNRPVVLVTLFVLCVAAIVWTFWPSSPESLYEQGKALMESSDPEDWQEGWDRYLSKLQEKYPDNPHREEVEGYRRKLEEHRTRRVGARPAPQGAPLSEAEWFYRKGLRQRQQGDEAGARATWEGVVRGFRDVPGEQGWVRLAEQELARDDAAKDERRLDGVRSAIEQARRLRAGGKPQEADEVLDALEKLYRDDPSARDIVAGARKAEG
jgi:hypothetical protein